MDLVGRRRNENGMSPAVAKGTDLYSGNLLAEARCAKGRKIKFTRRAVSRRLQRDCKATGTSRHHKSFNTIGADALASNG